MADGGGDFYFVDLASGLIHRFRLEEREQPVEFSSVEMMFRTIAEAYERGAYFVDGDGYLEMKDEVFARVATTLNPDIAWWR